MRSSNRFWGVINSDMRLSDFPDLGFGVGLRREYYDLFLRGEYGAVEWVEALTENYLPWDDEKFRRPFSTLEKIRRDLPVVLHGVSLSIGSADPLDQSYLRRLKALANAISPVWLSDRHECGCKGLPEAVPQRTNTPFEV